MEWSAVLRWERGTLSAQEGSSPPLVHTLQEFIPALYQISVISCVQSGEGGTCGTRSALCTIRYLLGRVFWVQAARTLLPTLGWPKVQTSATFTEEIKSRAQRVARAPPRECPVIQTVAVVCLPRMALTALRTKVLLLIQDWQNPLWTWQFWQPGQLVRSNLRFWIQFLVSAEPLKLTTTALEVALQPTKTWMSQDVSMVAVTSVRGRWTQLEQDQLLILAMSSQAMLLAQAALLARLVEQAACPAASRIVNPIILLLRDKRSAIDHACYSPPPEVIVRALLEGQSPQGPPQPEVGLGS